MDRSKTGSTGKTSKAVKGAKKAKTRFQRMRYAPLDFESKETLAGVSALPPLLYGQAGKTLPSKMMHSLRRAALQGIWHGAGNFSCAEIAFTLFLKPKGHRVDPVQAVDWSSIQALRRVVSKNPASQALAHAVWDLVHRQNPRLLKVVGPVTRALSIFQSCSWDWASFDKVTSHDNKNFKLFYANHPSSKWPHKLILIILYAMLCVAVNGKRQLAEEETWTKFVLGLIALPPLSFTPRKIASLNINGVVFVQSVEFTLLVASLGINHVELQKERVLIAAQMWVNQFSIVGGNVKNGLSIVVSCFLNCQQALKTCLRAFRNVDYFLKVDHMSSGKTM